MVLGASAQRGSCVTSAAQRLPPAALPRQHGPRWPLLAPHPAEPLITDQPKMHDVDTALMETEKFGSPLVRGVERMLGQTRAKQKQKRNSPHSSPSAACPSQMLLAAFKAKSISSCFTGDAFPKENAAGEAPGPVPSLFLQPQPFAESKMNSESSRPGPCAMAVMARPCLSDPLLTGRP